MSAYVVMLREKTTDFNEWLYVKEAPLARAGDSI